MRVKHPKNCNCDICFREAIILSVNKQIKKTVKENPGRVCPFCSTNPSKPAPYGGGWKNRCGHEVREKGLVIGWRKDNKSRIYKCIYPEKTKKTIYDGKKWREDVS